MVKSQPNVFIRCDADNVIGIGHFVRCLSFGLNLKKYNFDPIFLFKHIGSEIVSKVNKHGFDFIEIPSRLSWIEEADYIENQLQITGKTIILDISHLHTFQCLFQMSRYFEILNYENTLVVFDGLHTNALINQTNAPADVVIMPYFGAKQMILKNRNVGSYLLGPEYFIFGSEYSARNFRKRAISQKVNKLLITFGGADPEACTAGVLEALTGLDIREVNIIVGQNFTKKLTDVIKKAAKQCQGSVQITHSPKSLLRHMLWCDLAISGTGLTKYELAVTGTPSLQISMYPEHAEINQYFEERQTAVHLGEIQKLHTMDIRTAISNLLNNYELRTELSYNGINVIDTNGSKRIIKEILL